MKLIFEVGISAYDVGNKNDITKIIKTNSPLTSSSSFAHGRLGAVLQDLQCPIYESVIKYILKKCFPTLRQI